MHAVQRRRTSLLISDQRIIWALSPVLEKLGFSCHPQSDKERFLKTISSTKTHLAIVDCNVRNAAETVAETRAAAGLPGMVIVALAPNERSAEGLRRAGADFVCDRGLDPNSVNRALQQAKSMVTGEKRNYPRTPVSPMTYLRYSFDGVQFCQAAIVDLSSGGVCIEALEGLQAGRTVHVSFSLPAMRTPINAIGDISWRDHSGRAGIRFTQIAASSVRQIERWLEAANRPFSSTLGLVPAKAAAGWSGW